MLDPNRTLDMMQAFHTLTRAARDMTVFAFDQAGTTVVLLRSASSLRRPVAAFNRRAERQSHTRWVDRYHSYFNGLPQLSRGFPQINTRTLSIGTRIALGFIIADAAG
jgi:hypothetical protein